jgi:hypothetical protein
MALAVPQTPAFFNRAGFSPCKTASLREQGWQGLKPDLDFARNRHG